jgi:hypothetical protein
MLAALLCRHLLQRYAATSGEGLHSYPATRFARTPPASGGRPLELAQNRLFGNKVTYAETIVDDMRVSQCLLVEFGWVSEVASSGLENDVFACSLARLAGYCETVV